MSAPLKEYSAKEAASLLRNWIPHVMDDELAYYITVACDALDRAANSISKAEQEKAAALQPSGSDDPHADPRRAPHLLRGMRGQDRRRRLHRMDGRTRPLLAWALPSHGYAFNKDSAEMSLYDTSTKLTRDGKPLKCRCEGEIFTVRHIHNPYGSDMCWNDARCDACGTTYREYVGHFEVAPELPSQGTER